MVYKTGEICANKTTKQALYAYTFILAKVTLLPKKKEKKE